MFAVAVLASMVPGTGLDVWVPRACEAQGQGAVSASANPHKAAKQVAECGLLGSHLQVMDDF